MWHPGGPTLWDSDPLICRKKLRWGWSGEQGLVEGVTVVDVAQSGSPEASTDWHINLPFLLSL